LLQLPIILRESTAAAPLAPYAADRALDNSGTRRDRAVLAQGRAAHEQAG
jgi:hypothetical protein